MDQLPVKICDSASRDPYFLLVKLCANDLDFEQSTLDIEACDGKMRWSIKGQTCSYKGCSCSHSYLICSRVGKRFQRIRVLQGREDQESGISGCIMSTRP